jgi:hypothetical protein
VSTLLRQLDECCPTWRETVSSDPLDAALELGLIDEAPVPRRPAGVLDFTDEKANLRRLREYYDGG